MTTQPLAASDLAARLVEVAARLDAVGIVPRTLEVSARTIGVQFADEAAVDRAADMFTDTKPADSDGALYSRVGFFVDVVTIHLYSPRTTARCVCGYAFNHRGAS